MLKEEFSEKIKEYMNKINIEISDKQIEKFFDYMNLLLEWNEKINLTAITEPEDIILKHFVDCATILKYIKDEDKIIDIGTGAGFPGIPLKILNEKLDITLMDSLNKRINFLNEVINKLDLKNIVAIHARAEELARNKGYREKFDIATSRAVANLSTLSEYMLPFVKKNGMVISMKGSNIEEEVKNAKKAIKILGGEIEKIDNFNLANTNNIRNIITIKKVVKTPKEFPRKAGKPSKEPIY